MGKDLSEGRGVTLNSLRDEQHCLNRRLLLAIQAGDLRAQEELRRELEEAAARMDRLFRTRMRGL